MPNELSIGSIASAAPPPENVASQRASNFSASSSSPAPSVLAKPAEPIANPTLRLDPSLGLVVIEFRDHAGSVASQIPSQRQMDAYRMHTETPHRETPSTPETDKPA